MMTYSKFYSIRFIRKLLSSKVIYKNIYYGRLVRFRSLYVAKNFEKKRISNGRFAPTSIEIELTNRCNVDCVFCPNSQMKRKRGTMSFETFKNIVDGIRGLNIPYIIISGFGEPLLDKGILQKLDFLNKNKDAPEIMLVSNGIAFTQEVVRAICERQLVDILSFSIDAGNRESWWAIHGVDGFDKVVHNISLIDKVKKGNGVTTPRIDLRYKDFAYNQGQFGNFMFNFQNISDEISIYANICTWPESTSKIEAVSKDMLIKIACPSLWNGLRINWNGDAVICPQDYEGKNCIWQCEQSFNIRLME